MNADAPRRLIVPYVVLIWCGASSVTCNIVHAFRHAGGDWVLPAMYGIGPVLVAVCLSHVAADGRTERFMRWVTAGIMLGSMAGSIGATAVVITPFAGLRLAWLYGLILDAAALAALRVILSDRYRKRAEGTAAERASAVAAEAGRLNADLNQARAELAVAAAEVQDLKSALNQRRSSARKPARSSGRKKTAGSGVRVPADVDTQAEAISIIDADPAITGAELGRRLGVSESYGCRLKRDLARAAAGPEAGN